MTTPTPRAGHPAPTNKGHPPPVLATHQRKHMRISSVAETRVQTWFYKAIIHNNDKLVHTLADAIDCIGTVLHLDYANEINLVNIKNNTEITEEELSDLDRPSHYYTHCHTNRSSATTTILIQIRTQYVETYYNVKDPIRDIQIRFPHWITFRFDDYLGVPTSLLGTIMNVPHKQINRDQLARAITANLPHHAAASKPIIKPMPIEFQHTSDEGRTSTTVVGIYGPTSIAAEISGTIRGILQNVTFSLPCGTSSAQYYSLSDLSGPNRKAAIELHLKKISNLTTVNLYKLKLHDLEEDISPDVCTNLLERSHKNCKLINSKQDLLQAYISCEHQATSARLSCFTDRNNNPILKIHSEKKHVHKIYEALYALDSSPHRVHFFYSNIYNALPPEAREYLATADSPSERQSLGKSANDLLRKLQQPRPSPQPHPTPSPAPTLQPTPTKSYATATNPRLVNTPTVTANNRIEELERTIASLTSKVESQTRSIKELTACINNLQELHNTAPSMPEQEKGNVTDMDCDPQAAYSEFFSNTLQCEFDKLRRQWADCFTDVLEQSEIFSPLNIDARTEDWALLMAAGILFHLKDVNSEFDEQTKEDFSRLILKPPPKFTFPFATSSPEKSIDPPPPASPNPDHSPEIIDLTMDTPTPQAQPAAPTDLVLPPIPSPSPPSPTPATKPTSPQPSDTYMTGSTSTSKRPSSPSGPSRLINLKTKIKKMNPQLTDYFTRSSATKLIVTPATKPPATAPNNIVPKPATDSAGLAH